MSKKLQFFKLQSDEEVLRRITAKHISNHDVHGLVEEGLSPRDALRKLTELNKVSNNPNLFRTMKAIELEYGPIIDNELPVVSNSSQQPQSPSMWYSFFDAILRANKFEKLKTCINNAKDENGEAAMEIKKKLMADLIKGKTGKQALGAAAKDKLAATLG